MPRKGANAETRKIANAENRKTKKLSVPISADVDLRLYGIAASLGITRAELAARLIDQGLRRYAADAELRRIAGEIGAAGEGAGGGGE